MIFIHTTPDTAAPFWLLHFQSLTLAKLIFYPGGSHLLEVQGNVNPSKEVFMKFLAATESIGTGFSIGITKFTHNEKPGDFPETLTLIPLEGSGFAAFTTRPPSRCAIAHITSVGPIGPIWEHLPTSPDARQSHITLLLENAKSSPKINLDKLAPPDELPALWLERSDTLASSH